MDLKFNSRIKNEKEDEEEERRRKRMRRKCLLCDSLENTFSNILFRCKQSVNFQHIGGSEDSLGLLSSLGDEGLKQAEWSPS